MELPNVPQAVRQRTRAFTLVEALVAMGVSSLVLIALASIMLFTGRTFAALFNYVDLDDANRIAMDVVSRDIRTANRMVNFVANEFTIEDATGANLTYRYSPDRRTLTRISSSGSRVLLKQCDNFMFNVCQRTPKDAVANVFPAADVATAKVIDLSWVCSRSILGKRANTESVQTARIVIRKQGPVL